MLATKVILLGIDAVGKTSLLYKLKLKEMVQTLPTIGFNVEKIKYKDRNIWMWDVGGGYKISQLWKHYLSGVKCIIFMVNISDKERLEEYRESFKNLLEKHKDHRNIPIIVFCNKFKEEEFEPEEIFQKVSIPPEINPVILKGNVSTGEGLPEFLEYIYNNMEFEEEKEVEKEEVEKYEEEVVEEEAKKSSEKKDFKVRMFGLDGAGKTTILYLLKLGEKITTIPTIGFNVERIQNKTWCKDIEIWDIGGMEKIRVLWRHYFKENDGLIWTYDISNEKEIEQSQTELIKILTDSEINEKIPLLIYANKTDLNKSNNSPEIFLKGVQDYLKDRPCFIQECNKNDIESYRNGLAWLYNHFNIQ